MLFLLIVIVVVLCVIIVSHQSLKDNTKRSSLLTGSFLPTYLLPYSYFTDLLASLAESCSKYNISYFSGNHFMLVLPTIISMVFLSRTKTFS
mmetsp:Transcript_41857/g.58872  ORF Transcript_41857/g.58872 Transcript_41857/m.58872 type:complete len:92 (-) Transcript_41857:376-651(-)